MTNTAELEHWLLRQKDSETDLARLRDEVARAEDRVKRCKGFVRIERQRLIPRKRTESPLQYYARAHQVIDSMFHRFNGHYYCNPAHCRRKFKSKQERDKHLTAAYGVLE